MCLLKTVMIFLVKAQLIKKHSDDISKIKFCDSSSHLPDDELFVEDSTAALSVHLSDNDGERLMNSIREFCNSMLVLCGRCSRSLTLYLNSFIFSHSLQVYGKLIQT